VDPRPLPRRPLAILALVAFCSSAMPGQAAAYVESAAAEPDLSEVRDLYEQGKAKFDTFDYAGAVEVWTRVYAKLGDSPREQQIRNDVVYNIAMAQEKAFDLDHDVAHLRQATQLLRKYVEDYKTLHQATPQGRQEVERVEARIAELDQKIAGSSGTPDTTPDPAIEPIPPPPPPPQNKQAMVKDLLRNDPEIHRQYSAGRNMIVAGAVSVAIGGVLLISLVSLSSQYHSGWRTPYIAVGSIGGALAVTGAVLIGIGVPTKNKAVRAARARVGAAPVFSRQFAGAAMTYRF